MIGFKIKGVKVTISFLYVALITFFNIYDRTGVLILGILSALFHEICHLLAILMVGGKPSLISFEIVGIKINQPKTLKFGSQAIVLTAGCLGNLGLLIFGLCQNQLSLATINLCLLIFNLLPSKVLDGGQLILLLLERVFKLEVAFIVFKIISILFSIIIIILGTLLVIYFKNPTLILTGVFLNVSAFMD